MEAVTSEWLDILHLRGYNTILGFLELTPQETQVYNARAKYSKSIFNNAGKNDKKRKQINVDLPEEHRALFSKLQSALSAQFIQTVPPIVIKSSAGCKQQYWHTDYPRKIISTFPRESVPCSVLVALSENGADLCVANEDKGEHTVHIHKGDAIVFRGDLVHAGAAYQDENLRLHLYFDNKTFQRPLQTTWRVRKLPSQKTPLIS